MIFVTADNLEWARFALAIALVLANVAVWTGVYLEGDRFSEEIKKRGWRILVVALAAEAAFAAVLVVIDSEISRRQKAEIATFETKLEQTGDFALRQAMGRGQSFDWSACTKLIDEKRATKVEIVWLKSSPDARMLADRITHCLMGVDGWSQTKPLSVESIDSMPNEANSSGVTVMGKTGGLWLLNTDAPADFIMQALEAGMKKVPSGIRFSPDRSLPADLVRVVVGPK